MHSPVQAACAFVGAMVLPIGVMLGSIELKAIMHQRDQARHHVAALKHQLQTSRRPAPKVTVTIKPRATASPNPGGSPSSFSGVAGAAKGGGPFGPGTTAPSRAPAPAQPRPTAPPRRPPPSGSGGCPAGTTVALTLPLGVLPHCVTVRASASVR